MVGIFGIFTKLSTNQFSKNYDLYHLKTIYGENLWQITFGIVLVHTRLEVKNLLQIGTMFPTHDLSTVPSSSCPSRYYSYIWTGFIENTFMLDLWFRCDGSNQEKHHSPAVFLSFWPLRNTYNTVVMKCHACYTCVFIRSTFEWQTDSEPYIGGHLSTGFSRYYAYLSYLVNIYKAHDMS